LLLEYILLQAEMLELKYNPDRQAVWVVVDAYKDPKQWVVASLIVLTWTLKNWDIIVAYNTYWKVRRMQNWLGKNVSKITWW
jgi:translation initiation factor IF-2